MIGQTTPEDVYTLVLTQHAKTQADVDRLFIVVCILVVAVAIKMVITFGILLRVMAILKDSKLYFQAAKILGKQTDTAQEGIQEEHVNVALVAKEAKEKLTVVADDVKAVKEVVVEGKTPPGQSGEVILHNRRSTDHL